MRQIRDISLDSISFNPVDKQIIYVEPHFDEGVNRFVISNYARLKQDFRRHGMEFVYAPMSLQNIDTRYYIPCLDTPVRPNNVRWLAFVDMLTSPSGNCAITEPSLVFFKCGEINAISIYDDNQDACCAECFEACIKQINDDYSDIDYSHRDERPDYSDGFSLFFREPDPDKADTSYDDETRWLIREVVDKIGQLQQRGVNTLFLQDLIEQPVELSRLRITKDWRIILPDYGFMEIDMPALPKAVYILFLKMESKIRFKELPEHREELYRIYRQLAPIGTTTKNEQTIEAVTDPCKNRINEVCANIREAFLRKIENRIARAYYITGERGEAKGVSLDRSMIEWE